MLQCGDGLALTGEQEFFLRRDGRGISKRTACARFLGFGGEGTSTQTSGWNRVSRVTCGKRDRRGSRRLGWEAASRARLSHHQWTPTKDARQDGTVGMIPFLTSAFSQRRRLG